MKRRAFFTVSAGLAAGLAIHRWAGSAPLVQTPASGPATAETATPPVAGHRTLELDWQDPARGRPVPVRLYLPLRASAAHPVPLVIFSHGLGGARSGYSYLGSHWADHGLASLHPQHTGSDNSVWRGNPLTLVMRLQTAAQEAEALARVQDLRFAVNQLLASETGPLIDAHRMAVAGHSYGANTAMLVSGARVTSVIAGADALRDTRIRAAILISAPPLLGQGPVQQVLGAVRIPTLHITSTDDTINIPGYESTVQDRIAIFEAMRESPRSLAVFNTGGHSIFTDRITSSGPETSARIKGATRELSTLFLRQTLQAQTGPAGANADPTHEVVGEITAEYRQWQLRYQSLLDRFILTGSPVAVG